MSYGCVGWRTAVILAVGASPIGAGDYLGLAGFDGARGEAFRLLRRFSRIDEDEDHGWAGAFPFEEPDALTEPGEGGGGKPGVGIGCQGAPIGPGDSIG